MKKVPSFRLFCCTLLLLAVGCGHTASAASGGMHLSKPSTNYEIGMLFHKLAKTQPNFENWLSGEARFKQLDESQRAMVMSEEQSRLGFDFANTDPRTKPIIIRASVKVALKNFVKPSRSLEVDFPMQGIIYFPYIVGDEAIAVIPNGIELYENIPISKPEASAIAALLDQGGESTLVLEVIATKVDAQQPMDLDGISQWLMMGEIGFIGIFNSKAQAIWSVQAPWHKMQDEKDLKSLQNAGQSLTTTP